MRKFSVGDCGFGQCVYLATMEVRILPPPTPTETGRQRPSPS